MPHGDAPLLEAEPREDHGREVTSYEKHFVAFAKRDTVRQQMKAVGGAVGERDLVRWRAEKLRKCRSQPSGDVSESLRGEVVRRLLPLDGFLRCLGRNPR